MEGGILLMGVLSERQPGKALCPALAICLPSLLQNWDCLFLRAPPLPLTLPSAPFCSNILERHTVISLIIASWRMRVLPSLPFATRAGGRGGEVGSWGGNQHFYDVLETSTHLFI